MARPRRELATLSERIAEAEELVRIGVRLVRNCHASYLEASPEVRRLWNEALFKRIVIRDRRVARLEHREPFAALLDRGCNKAPSRTPAGRHRKGTDQLRRLRRFVRGGD